MGAKDAIGGAGSEGEVITVDAAFWGAFDLDFVEFFGERTAVAGGKFKSTDEVNGGGPEGLRGWGILGGGGGWVF